MAYLRPTTTHETLRDRYSIVRLLPLLFLSALFVVVTGCHMLALLKISSLDSPHAVAISETAERSIRLVQAIDSHRLFSFIYALFCVTTIWFAAFRRYPIWTGWLLLVCLTGPWLLYLKACLTLILGVG